MTDAGGSSGDSSGSSGSDSGGGCTPNAALRCDGTTLVSCSATGDSEVQTACILRCDGTSLTCKDKVDPSNGFAAHLDAAATEPAISITSTQSTSTNTDDYNMTNGTLLVANQTVKAAFVAGANGAPDVVVIKVGSFNIASGARFTSYGARALAIMSAGDVTIAGTFDLNGGFGTAREPCWGIDSGGTGADNDVPGGGGGGYATAGASGGGINGVAAGKSGGTAIGNATLIPLRGGCSGGTDGLGAAGRGGGVAQITSATKIDISGAIGAHGTGGTVASGGGTGGSILLEAPRVTITGGVYANGGGGGCGGFSAGANGTNTLTPAPGANCNGAAGTAPGGNGGAGTTAPTNGGTTLNRAGQVDRAGGGGGSVGRIRVNTLDSQIIGAGAQSPPASKGALATR